MHSIRRVAHDATWSYDGNWRPDLGALIVAIAAPDWRCREAAGDVDTHSARYLRATGSSRAPRRSSNNRTVVGSMGVHATPALVDRGCCPNLGLHLPRFGSVHFRSTRRAGIKPAGPVCFCKRCIKC